MLEHAVVRLPAPTFAEGLTTAGLGAPSLDAALEQHARYCEALERCGLSVTRLDADPRYPDSTFVEDTAVLTPRGTILARPGAPAREGEVEAIRPTLERLRGGARSIRAPGALDGGDVCEADGHYFIGISGRTNPEGARQLSALLAEDGYTSSTIDIRRRPELLHLKSGMAYVGEGRVLAVEALAEHEAFRDYKVLPVDRAEGYAANCVLVGRSLLLAAGFPRLESSLRREGFSVVPLAMSEFQKMDGGLSCLSLRY